MSSTTFFMIKANICANISFYHERLKMLLTECNSPEVNNKILFLRKKILLLNEDLIMINNEILIELLCLPYDGKKSFIRTF
jgi:hypothetical protein